MTSHYHQCYVCEVDLLPAPCACRDSDVFTYRCAAEDRNVCDERAGAEREEYIGEYE